MKSNGTNLQHVCERFLKQVLSLEGGPSIGDIAMRVLREFCELTELANKKFQSYYKWGDACFSPMIQPLKYAPINQVKARCANTQSWH